MPTHHELLELATQAMRTLERKGLSVVTAESCTAGMLATLLSEVAGAAERLHGGFVTYTKENKTAALGVAHDLLAKKGAVSREVAIAMAEGALRRSPAQVAVAITGVAGPEPDEDGNPVGLVCVAVARHGHASFHAERSYGDLGRDEVRACAMADALQDLQAIAQRD
jgi:nicotinamide-nucleotide amidase